MIIGKKGAPREKKKKDGISLFFQKAGRQSTGDRRTGPKPKE